MIPAEKLKLKVAAGFLRDNFGWNQLPEPVLIDLDRLQMQLAANLFDPAAYLGPHEFTTFQGFTYRKRKIEWLGGRLAAKQAVLHLTGRAPTARAMREWVISADQYGKPFFTSPAAKAPEISISHSHGLALAMAVAGKACGLDIQKISEATVRVKEKFRTPAEEELIASLGRSLPPAAGLTLLWAAKEALRKGRGGHPLTGLTAMQLIGPIKKSGDCLLLTVRTADHIYPILASFYKDYAVALGVIQQP
jgi:phosphopantetheinyl transferase